MNIEYHVMSIPISVNSFERMVFSSYPHRVEPPGRPKDTLEHQGRCRAGQVGSSELSGSLEMQTTE